MADRIESDVAVLSGTATKIEIRHSDGKVSAHQRARYEIVEGFLLVWQGTKSFLYPAANMKGATIWRVQGGK